MSYLAKKSYGEAEAAFQEVLKGDPQDANGLFAMGTLQEAQGNGPKRRAGIRRPPRPTPCGRGR